MASPGILPVNRVTSQFRVVPHREVTPPIRKIFGSRTASFRLHTGAWTGAQQGCGWILDDGLVAVNIHPPASNVWWVFFDLLGDNTNEFASRIHLQKLWPFQRPAFVNFLKSAWHLSLFFGGQQFSLFKTAGHIVDGQSVFVCFSVPATPHRVVRKKKKVCLAWAHGIWGEKCVLGKEDRFAKGLGVSAIFCAISETFAGAACVLMAAMSFQ